MSFKARRQRDAVEVTQFDWAHAVAAALPGAASLQARPVPAPLASPAAAAVAPPPVEPDAARIAAIEHEAFVKGYAQGERAGMEAAATRGQAMMRRLGETVQELTALRADMIQRTERQVVQLAMAIAERMIQREISLDRGILVGMARVALDRLSEQATASIRLNPEDYAAIAPKDLSADSGPVQVVADPLVARGGCLVQSDFGFMDADVASQFRELSRVLLDETAPNAMHG